MLLLLSPLFVDVDECTDQLAHCHELATCHNTFGGYECLCEEEGYEGDGENECSGEFSETISNVDAGLEQWAMIVL